MSKQVLDYWEAKADDYRNSAYHFYDRGGRYPFYETRLNLMDDMVKHLPAGRLFDAGCGGGALVIHFLKKGWDAFGADGAENMVTVAQNNLKSQNFETTRVCRRDVTDLHGLRDGEFDLVTSAGVMEYLSPEEDARAFAEAHRILKPGGYYLVENINGLFDISTFNRFTVRFFEEQCFPLFFDDPAQRASLVERLRTLVTHPDKPDVKGRLSTTRDQVYTKSEIPLAYGARAAAHGFRQLEQGFYRFHAVPPLFFEASPELERVPIEKELPLSRHWIGNFLASGFVSLLQKD